MNANEGGSNFIILYHRTPFDEATTESGERIWKDQKSPNGIIPTLRNLFRDRKNGTWIAWRQVESLSESDDERIAMADPAPFTLRRIPLEEKQISCHVERIILANPSHISKLLRCQQYRLEYL